MSQGGKRKGACKGKDGTCKRTCKGKEAESQGERELVKGKRRSCKGKEDL